MTAEKKDRRPLRIKNLADLKRHIKLGTELVATAHQYHPDIVGLTRVVTKVQTNGFYSKIKDQPDHKWSTCNHGMGFWSPFNKANAYHFTDSTVQVLNTRKNDGSVLYEMELYDGRQSMSEQNKEVPDMNEWERLHRQAQRYKEAYPPPERGSCFSAWETIQTPWKAAREERSESWMTSALCTVISIMAGASALSPAKIHSAS